MKRTFPKRCIGTGNIFPPRSMDPRKKVRRRSCRMSHRRYRFTPNPAGTRWYHTHTMAHADLTRAGFSGQFGFAIVEPARHPGDYDQEICIAMHHWEPSLGHRGLPTTAGKSCISSATFNGKMLGAGEPVRVRKGQRILFRLLNASATDEIRLALPGHRFRVIAMDGNPVARPQTVDMLYLDIGERIDAIVEMNNPGVWVFGSVKDEERKMGMGVVVEYAGKSGDPQWQAARESLARGPWDYAHVLERSRRARARSQVRNADSRRSPAIKKISITGPSTASLFRISKSCAWRRASATACLQ